jgi:heat shock protein HspQ
MPINRSNETQAHGSKDFPHTSAQTQTDELAAARFGIGDVVRHRLFPFRGVIFDVDPTFNNTEEWWQSIPEEIRPSKDQPFYHLLAENEQTTYVAYVSQQNLVPDDSHEPVQHPAVPELFAEFDGERYRLRNALRH